MDVIQLIINGKSLAEIMNGSGVPGLTALNDAELTENPMRVNPIQYDNDIERINPPNLKRTDNGYMPSVTILNQKASIGVTFPPLKAEWLQNFLLYLGLTYPENGLAYTSPVTNTTFNVSYPDMTGARTMECYVGLKLRGTLAVATPGIAPQMMWKGVKISFIER